MHNLAASAFERLSLRRIGVQGVLVPLARALVTRVATLRSVPLVLIDIQTEEGIVGRAYVVAYLPDRVPLFRVLLSMIETRTKGARIDPLSQFDQLRQSLTLLGHEGLAAMALAGFDMACWDALAQAAVSPLARLLGGEVRGTPAYNSNGLGLASPEELREAVPSLMERGFTAVKMRLGREHPAEDLAAVRTVRAALPDEVGLMGDFNQCLSPAHAIARCMTLDSEGLVWIEEPVAYDDLEASAQVAKAIRTPVQIGENLYGARSVAAAIQAQAADLLMPDAQRVGGVTGWLRAAAMASRARIPMSSHLLPEVSAQLLAVTPTAHWLEYVDWAEPVLAEPLVIQDGVARPSVRPGVGLSWDQDAVRRYAMAD